MERTNSFPRHSRVTVKGTNATGLVRVYQPNGTIMIYTNIGENANFYPEQLEPCPYTNEEMKNFIYSLRNVGSIVCDHGANMIEQLLNTNGE